MKGEKLTKKQKDFADEYIKTGNGTQSALKAYNVKKYNTANVVAVENLQKPTVLEYIQRAAQGAAERIEAMSINAENEAVRLSANKDVLDRAGYKAVERTMSVQVNVDTNNPKAFELAQKYEEELKKNLNVTK